MVPPPPALANVVRLKNAGDERCVTDGGTKPEMAPCTTAGNQARSSSGDPAPSRPPGAIEPITIPCSPSNVPERSNWVNILSSR